ncbi:NAD(P)H-binding protein [Elizabethkingia argentiflava]|uniref:NAD(P)H-binding protein n=1 Tax=Elizabethkingia argenteiflava TaxID=2681556 RepID=A0A845PZ07_9FLAO|nr:SDR family oxidoreductase [Elizabethkingia argenteiflava]NAW52141.1 NAD(P)H-binding protein [Elizabethkingia argenteiflava]
MEQIKIGVTGATGQLGRKVIENLKKEVDASQIVALVRHPEKAQDLGVEARAFDYDHPEQICEALKGISKLLLISSNEIGKRFPQHKNVIDGAKKAGVSSIAYTSLLRTDISPLGLAAEHKETEHYLKSCGLDYTLLRNGWYIENYTASLSGVLQSGAVYGSAGNGKISAATRNDYAKAAVRVLTGEGHKNKIYELGGNAFTMSDYAAEISKQSGKDIQYIDLSVEEYAKVLEEKAHMPAPTAQFFASVDAEVNNGALETNDNRLAELIGGHLESLGDAVKAALLSIQ